MKLRKERDVGGKGKTGGGKSVLRLGAERVDERKTLAFASQLGPNAPSHNSPPTGSCMSLPTRCINPRCPSLRASNNGWFKNEHALHIHLGRTPECREYWAAADNDANQPPDPQTSPLVPIQPPFFEPTIPSGEHEEDEQMESEGSDSHAPSEPSFRILDYPGAALRYTNRVGTEWERRKAREGPDRRYGPFADADEYGLVKWAVESSQSLAAINGLLRTKYVRGGSKRPKNHSNRIG